MRKLSILVLGLVLLAGACNKSKPAENSQTTSPESGSSVEIGMPVISDTENNVPEMIVAKTYEIKITTAGFEPSTLTIKNGDSVKFVNSDTRLRWPASAPHPTHTDYPAFDAKKGITAGESWSFTFDKVGTWKFHDHLVPNTYGSITVQ